MNGSIHNTTISLHGRGAVGVFVLLEEPSGSYCAVHAADENALAELGRQIVAAAEAMRKEKDDG